MRGNACPIARKVNASNKGEDAKEGITVHFCFSVFFLLSEAQASTREISVPWGRILTIFFARGGQLLSRGLGAQRRGCARHYWSVLSEFFFFPFSGRN